MMQSIHATFDRLRRARRTALMPFIMGGDPIQPRTGQVLLALQDAGADLIEVGIPFSDPLADGPVIQGASARALARGVTPARVLADVASVRRRLTVPVVALSYWNPLVQFAGPSPRSGGRNGAGRRGADGTARSLRTFIRAAQEAGLSGVIVPDLPVEEGGALRTAAAAEDFAAVCLAAPTSGLARLRMIARASQGFIYYVSVTGTTGVRRTLPTTFVQGVRQLQRLTSTPVCVGFGVSTPAHASRVAAVADGVIVGSALIRTMERARGRAAALTDAAAFITRLRRAVT